MASKSYRSSGVDLNLMDSLKERIKAYASLTHGAEVLDSQGSFAGLFQLTGFKEPLLVASTDGVGTKLKIAAQLDHYESVGQDLVSLNVNDILTKGAKPLFFLDYVAFSSLDEQLMDSLIRGIVWGCKVAGCALIGGETAQMPDMVHEGGLELAGFVVGAVERDAVVDGKNIQPGDYLIGVPSSGLHTNGFSLVRQVFGTDENPNVLFRKYEGLDHHLGEELLVRHRCYYPELEPVLGLVKGLAHITGGGLPGKMPSILPPGVAAEFDTNSWEAPPIFQVIQSEGSLDSTEMYRVFNMGLGMVAVCQENQVSAFIENVPDAIVVGRVVEREGDEQVIIQA